MAKSLLCDRCHGVIGDVELANNNVPDFVVNVCGRDIARFEDLCESCSDDIIQKVAILVPLAFDAMADEFDKEIEIVVEEQQYQEALDEGLVEVATIDELPEEFLEGVSGYVPGKYAAFDTANAKENKKRTERDGDKIEVAVRPPLELDENTGLFC